MVRPSRCFTEPHHRVLLIWNPELSFAEGATVTDLEFPDEDWWFGHHGGHSGLFPANYVQLDS